MKIQTVMFAICVLLVACTEAESDYQKGMTAHRSGNYVEAVKWFRKGAKQGDAEAQLWLGLSYTDGIGVTQNYKKGIKWFRKAAEQGNVEAQIGLGAYYADGRGVTKNDQTAYMWFFLAEINEDEIISEGIEQIMERGIALFESRLSRAEIEAAEKEAAKMHAKINKNKADR